MNAKRVREIKLQYAVSLIEILRSVCEAGERSEEHAEAIRQVEKALLACVEFPTQSMGSNVEAN
jgi:hypothetical protein